jgi:hypothetical protein
MTSVAPILILAEPFAYHEGHQMYKLKPLKLLAGSSQIIGIPLQVLSHQIIT